ncbi:MAG: DUF4348 domain-containing protein [Bacteroidaceae bacterium]
MKKIILGLVVLLLLFSCGNKKSKMDPFEPLTGLIDSITTEEDSVPVVVKEDKSQFSKADESFDDFIYSFASDEETQRKRILFPLPFYNKNTTSKIEEKYWKQDVLFTRQEYYTLLFDRETEMDISKDTSLNSVQFEWIYMRTRMVKKYYFQRSKGVWRLEAINLHPLGKNENENFIDFFYKFATDSVFQSERVRKPLAFVTTDPDDDFAILETTLELNQWQAFMPTLPKDKLSNINYGQRHSDDSTTKILALKGIGNGFSNTLYFQRTNGEWELTKFEDLSN